MAREGYRENPVDSQFSSKSYYEILGVSPDASQDEIRDAFIQLSKEHHPDAGGEDRTYQWISEAYTSLKNPDTRLQHDIKLNVQRRPPEAGPYEHGGVKFSKPESVDAFFRRQRRQEAMHKEQEEFEQKFPGELERLRHQAIEYARQDKEARRDVYNLRLEHKGGLMYLVDSKGFARSHGYKRIETKKNVLIGTDEVGDKYGMDPLNGEVQFDGYGFDRIEERGELLIGIDKSGREQLLMPLTGGVTEDSYEHIEMINGKIIAHNLWSDKIEEHLLDPKTGESKAHRFRPKNR